MHHKLTPSQENYLEHILLGSSEGQIRVRDLAESVGVKLPSVTRAVQKLAEVGMVRHRAYGRVEITNTGKNAAQSIARRDNCLMRFLVDVLELPDELAKSEACRIEHVISEDVLRRLELLLNHLSRSSKWKRKLHKGLDSLGNSRTRNGQAVNRNG